MAKLKIYCQWRCSLLGLWVPVSWSCLSIHTLPNHEVPAGNSIKLLCRWPHTSPIWVLAVVGLHHLLRDVVMCGRYTLNFTDIWVDQNHPKKSITINGSFMVNDGHLFMIGHLRGRNLDPIPQPSHTIQPRSFETRAGPKDRLGLIEQPSTCGSGWTVHQSTFKLNQKISM